MCAPFASICASVVKFICQTNGAYQTISCLYLMCVAVLFVQKQLDFPDTGTYGVCSVDMLFA